MKVLAFDTSQKQALVALLVDGKITNHRAGGMRVSHSESLLPHIDGILKEASVSLSQIDAIAVGIGPGSFTGLRIGLSTAKALSHATGKLLYPFSSLKAHYLSYSADLAVQNAFQGEAFIGYFSGERFLETAAPFDVWTVGHKEWIKSSERRRVCGSDLNLFPSIQSSGDFETVPNSDLIQIEGMAQVVNEVIKQGKPQSYLQVAANYLRSSSAEIKLHNKIGS